MVKRIFVVVVFSVFMICAYELLKDFGFPHVAILFSESLVFFSCIGVIFHDMAVQEYRGKKPETWGKATKKSQIEKDHKKHLSVYVNSKRPTPNKGKKMSEAQKKKISDTKKAQFAQKKAQVARNAKGKFVKKTVTKK